MMPMKRMLICLALSLVASAARADEDDTRRLQDELSWRLQQQRQSQWPAAMDGDAQHITIDGQLYRVGDDAEGLARGLYYALNTQQWAKVTAFLARYRVLPEHEPQLVLLAEGLMARAQHAVGLAIEKLQAAQALAPEDVRIQLELARLYTEDHQNPEALATFGQVLQQDLPPVTAELVESHMDHLKERDQWHGSLSVGSGYNNNVNQAKGGSSCAAYLGTECWLYQRLPEAQGAMFQRYQLALSKQWSMGGHHSWVFKPLAYGTKYQLSAATDGTAQRYSDHTTVVAAGYRYADARSSYTVTPVLEHYFRGGHTHYWAFGLEAEWSRELGQGWRVNAQARAKRVRYAGQERQWYADYSQYTAGVGVNHAFSSQAGWFLSADVERKKYPLALSSSKEILLRSGGYKLFDGGYYVNALALHRRSDYDAYAPMLDVRRQDRQTLLMASVGVLKWRYRNVYPELQLKRVVNHSNSQFYGYSQNELSLNLRHNF